MNLNDYRPGNILIIRDTTKYIFVSPDSKAVVTSGIKYSEVINSYLVNVKWLGNVKQPDGGYSPEVFDLYEDASIVINGKLVEFKVNGIQVGCTFVKTEDVIKIYNKLCKNQGTLL